jgi:hypothetical protein
MSTPISDLPFTQPTPLPERDIPRETLPHAADPQTVANYMPRQAEYIPPPAKYDYSYLVEEFRIPIILSLLYYIFQLDMVQGFIVRMVPSLLHEGKVTSNGVLVKSGLFGAAYYAITLLMQHFK